MPPAGTLAFRSATGDGWPQLATTEILQQKTADVEPVPDQAKRQLVAGLPLLPPGHREAMVSLAADGEPHVFTLEVFVGGKAIRPELGQVLVAVSHEGEPFGCSARRSTGRRPG